MEDNLYKSYGPDTKRKRPRTREKYEWLKMMEIKNGKPTGEVGNRVWVNAEDYSKGYYELNEDGKEIKWYPNPESTKKSDKQGN